MRDSLKRFAAKSLKSFLKKKKIGYTAALLTVFLITGGIGQAATAELEAQVVSTQEQLIANIEAQKAEIAALLEENEKRLGELKENQLTLVRKGDYYLKSIYPSTQVFFNFGYESSGKMKDRTTKEFAHDIEIVEKYLKVHMGKGISGLSDDLLNSNLAGNLSARELSERLLRIGNGAVSIGMPHSLEVDLGVNVTPLNPIIPVVSKNIKVNIDVPSVPQVSISVPNPIIPIFPTGLSTPPAVGAITAPTVSVNVVKPNAIAPITVAAVNPTAPNSISLNAPTVTVNVTPPVVEPTMAQPPVIPDAPSSLNFNVTPTGPGIFAAPNAPASVSIPVAPAAATPNVMTPPNITYNAFGQTEYMSAAVGGSYGLWMNNNENIVSNNAIIDINDTSMTMSSGSIATNVGSIVTGTTYNSTSSSSAGSFGPRTIISTTSKSNGLAMNVSVTGNYTINLNSPSACTYTFISLNTCWYGVGGVIELNGNVTLDNASASGGGVLVGIRHQTNGRDVQSTNATTRIAANKTMTLAGSYAIGALITTETAQETARTKFTNNGTIVVGGSSNIGVDFGVYDAFYPYVDVTAGAINVSGNNNYGIRIQNMSSYTPYYGTYDYKQYYKNITISNGNIKLSGTSSVGLNIAQKVGGATNVIDPVTNMTIEVGGTGNVGIYRDKNFEASHNGDLTVNSSTITTNGLNFSAIAKNGVLLRTDKFKSILATDIIINTGNEGNTAIQATNGSTGELATGKKIIAAGTGTRFTGMLSSGTGSIVTNLGTVDVSGDNSSGIAALSGGTANSSGILKVSGASSAAVYNDSKAIISGTVTAIGTSASGIFNKSTSTSLNTSATITASGSSATGIFNQATTGVSIIGGSISVTGVSGGTATGIYNSGILNATALTAINVNNYGVGAYNAGTITLDSGKINITGTNATGVYVKSGTMTLNGSLLDAIGNNSTALVYEGGTINIGSVVLKASGSGATGLYNLGTTLTSTPVINIAHNGNSGLYNAIGKSLTATGNINGANTYSGVAGIYNVGTLNDYSTGKIDIKGASSAGVYNRGTVTDISGTVEVEGNGSGITVGVYNTFGGTITDITGTIKAMDNATALYNAGTMKVSGTVEAGGTAQSTGIYNTGTGTLTLGTGTNINITGQDGTGIYNDSSSNLTLNGGNFSVTGNSSAALYHAGNGTFSMTNGIITTTGKEDAGIYNDTATGTFTLSGGSVTATGTNNLGSVGVYNKGTSTFNLQGTGTTVTATNKGSTGAYNEGTFNQAIGSKITATGESTTGMYNKGSTATFTMNGGMIETTGTKSSALYNSEGIINFTNNSTITANDGATGIYVAGGAVNTTSGKVVTINVNNTLVSPASGTKEGVGIFASNDGTNGSTVDLKGSNITAVNGSSAVASYGIGVGFGETNLDLTGATVDYDGEGFAVYSNGQYGKINLTGAQLHLRGKAIGVEMDYFSGVSPITFSSTTIDIHSNDVTLASLKDYGTPLQISNLRSGIGNALGSGVTINDNGFTSYNLARIDGGKLDIDVNISKTSGIGIPGYDYYRIPGSKNGNYSEI